MAAWEAGTENRNRRSRSSRPQESSNAGKVPLRGGKLNASTCVKPNAYCAWPNTCSEAEIMVPNRGNHVFNGSCVAKAQNMIANVSAKPRTMDGKPVYPSV